MLSGLCPKKGKAETRVRFVQIKDLLRSRRAFVLGAVPTAARATPIAPDDVLIVARGDGLIGIRPDNELIGAYPALDIYLVRPDLSRLSPDFLTAYLNAGPGGEVLRAASSGGSLPRVPKKAVERLPIPPLPLETQKTLGALEVARLNYATLIDRRVDADKRLMTSVIRKTITFNNTLKQRS